MESNQEETKEDRSKEYLEQIFDANYAWKTIEAIPNKLKVTMKTLTAQEQMDVDDAMSGVKGNQAKVLRVYALEVLGYAILKWNGSTMPDPETTKDKLKAMPGAITEKLVREQRDFEREVSGALGLEQVERNFSQRADQPSESEPSQKE